MVEVLVEPAEQLADAALAGEFHVRGEFGAVKNSEEVRAVFQGRHPLIGGQLAGRLERW